ncbi:PKD domain-containing protein [Saccharothrix australiensis]|uniref:PKD domain-containing protein n=1 Tax=Saccharothrix australiensis TaxID=2072 RepID=A0A495W359_9PSEU|nr:PKD domain-containing protein [Saccharothrix australiensis]RKT55123.1 PKD domain-containing protein [Saccharothrix australiensis]
MIPSERPGPRGLLIALAALLLGLAVPGVAHAAPPANDEFDLAAPIRALPFRTTLSTTEATRAEDDPYDCAHAGHTLWFNYLPPVDALVEVSTLGSDHDTVVAAYSGKRGSLAHLGCNDDFGGGQQSQLSFRVKAGEVYHFVVGAPGTPGVLDLAVTEWREPANDDFADAEPISTLPHRMEADASVATSEWGEPGSACEIWNQTVWYAYRPTETRPVTLKQRSYAHMAVYTGTSLPDLKPLTCATYDASTTFQAVAGQTYYVQLSPYYASHSKIEVDLVVAPSPAAAFEHDAPDPSLFDEITFRDASHDPGGTEIAALAWDFGDGATATGAEVRHRYAADGDYTARLTASTADGRAGTATKTIPVRTHDVGISGFAVPSSAVAGTSKPVTVTVANHRYDEAVRVTLYRSTPKGYVEVGSATQWLPKSAGRTSFPFRYTFTPDDGALGKVAFKAVVALEAGRDGYPSDNEVVAVPTRVSPAPAGRAVA